MKEKFVFYGQTTFIDQPRDIIIQNFQNQFFGGGPDSDAINLELRRLVELILSSTDLGKADKQETVQAISTVAEQVKGKTGSKLSVKGTLQAVMEVVAKAADIASPALTIIAAVLKLLSLG
jgi:hypothetical protein